MFMDNQEFTNLVELLRYRTQTQPHQVVYTFLEDGEIERGCLTYQDLDKIAQQIASYLQFSGVKGERALLLYPPGLEFISAFFGCLYAGVIAVPAYPPRRNQNMLRLQAIIEDAEAQIVLTTQSLLSKLESRLTENPDLEIVHLIATDNLPQASVSQWQQTEITSDSLAFLQYTSGSTGKPKGVMVSHGNLLQNSQDLHLGDEYTKDSVMITWLPTFHDMGLIYGVIQPLYWGFPCYIMAPASFVRKPITWLQAISKYKGTHSAAPNFAYDLCVRKTTSEQKAHLDLSSWQVAFNGAEPVRADVLQRFADTFKTYGFDPTAFCPAYGLAEATLKVTSTKKNKPPIFCSVDRDMLKKNQIVEVEANDPRGQTLVGCGWTEIDTQIVIVNPETFTSCLSPQIGEIWVSGTTIPQGYWQRPEATKQTFQAYIANTKEGPFLRTGDLGFVKDGELFITGRIKDVIIIRGRNYYPQDIEYTVAQSHPALKNDASAAFTIEINGEEHLVIAQEVERTYLRKLNVEEVVVAIRQAVAQQHELQVSEVILLRTSSIPKTSSGKIQRQACRQNFLEESLNIVGQWQQTLTYKPDRISTPSNPAPASPNSQQQTQTSEAIEMWLIAKVAKIINRPESNLDPHQSIVNYGLDSLVAMTLTEELEQWLGYRISTDLIYDSISIRALASQLAKNGATDTLLPDCLVPLQTSGNKQPFFCIHPLAGVTFPYYQLASLFSSDRPFYAVQAVGTNGKEKPLTTIEAMATRYIDALKVVQPTGPYFLGGWSFGSYVAFEMAVQLANRREEVAKIILLDTPPLTNNKTTNLLNLLDFFLTSSTRYIWSYVYDYLKLTNPDDKQQEEIELDLRYLSNFLNPQWMADFFTQKSQLSKFQQPSVQLIMEVILANSNALINYQPSVYSGQITLFSAKESWRLHGKNSSLEWMTLATKGLDIQSIPGHHFNILRKPHVETLAQKLEECLGMKVK